MRALAFGANGGAASRPLPALPPPPGPQPQPRQQMQQQPLPLQRQAPAVNPAVNSDRRPEPVPRISSLASLRGLFDWATKANVKSGATLRLTCLTKGEPQGHEGKESDWRVQVFELGDETDSMRAFCLDEDAVRFGRDIGRGQAYDVTGAVLTCGKKVNAHRNKLYKMID